jgi:hypothetical protein
LYDYDEEHDEYDDNEDHYEPPAKKSKSDENNNTFTTNNPSQLSGLGLTSSLIISLYWASSIPFLNKSFILLAKVL